MVFLSFYEVENLLILCSQGWRTFITMPPKKRAKTDLSAPSTSAAGQNAGKVQPSQNANSKKSRKAKTAAVSSMETRSKSKFSGSTFIEAAAGAGIYTTEQLKAIRKAGAATCQDDAVLIAPDPSELDALAPATSPEPQTDINLGAQSSSESEGEVDYEDGEIQPDPSTPLKRKITYDRDSNRFTATQISPGSLEDGRDTRDLAKLQQLLDSNPEAIDTLDSMIRAIKTSSLQSKAAPAAEVQVPAPPLPTTAIHTATPACPTNAGNLNHLINQTSETTIYTNAVPSASPSQQCPKGLESQQDLPVVSDDSEIIFSDPNNHVLAGNQPMQTPAQTEDQLMQQREERAAAKARTEQVILDAQRQRVDLARPSAGMAIVPFSGESQQQSGESTALIDRALILSRPGSHDLSCDDKLFQLTAHVDSTLILQIKNGEYVDFAKLLPREKVTPAQDQGKFQIVDDEGKPAFALYTPKDLYSINSFKKWELAFDIFAKIYADFYPLRAPELLEYKHIIRRGVELLPWTNVYNYDQIFRQHLEKNPGRTWSKKHHETWTNHVTDPKTTRPGTADGDNKKVKPPCRFFNKNGKCKRSRACDHDHKCSYCGLYGHGRYNCHKLQKKTGAPSPAASTSTASAATTNAN